MKNENKLPKGQVIGRDVAEAELNRWFDHRRVKESVRNNIDDDGNDSIKEKLMESFMYGELKFDEETGLLVQKLQEPIKTEKGEVKVSELNWKPRIREKDLHEPMKGVKPRDTFGMVKAYISAATGVDRNILGSLDLVDYSLAQSINNYFL